MLTFDFQYLTENFDDGTGQICGVGEIGDFMKDHGREIMEAAHEALVDRDQ